MDVDELLCSQPDSGEMALDVVDKLVRSSAVDIIVVDSVAALVPRGEAFLDSFKKSRGKDSCNVISYSSVCVCLILTVELEADMADQQMGLQARLMSKALRKITGRI